MVRKKLMVWCNHLRSRVTDSRVTDSVVRHPGGMVRSFMAIDLLTRFLEEDVSGCADYCNVKNDDAPKDKQEG